MAKAKSPKARTAPGKGGATFPTSDQILQFIRDSPAKVGKREIARAFHIKSNDRIRLKQTLKQLKADGLLDDRKDKPDMDPARLPSVLVVDIIDQDEDGELLARPSAWDEGKPLPKIYLSIDKPHHGGLAIGDRVLARLNKIGKVDYEARTIRKLQNSPTRVLGRYEMSTTGGRLRPVDRRAKKDYLLNEDQANGAEPGELVLAEVLSGQRGPRLGLKPVRVLERLGSAKGLKSFSLIAIHEHNLPDEFSHAAIDLAKQAGPVDLGTREDLRNIPLVTIDGADARDFDDAVFAAPDDDPKNSSGWRLTVAIADVAHYVRAGDALDREAKKRGNSTYFPDRVLPMLPEALSNGWCSLVPNQERPCLAAHLRINAQGELIGYKFRRALMKSAARLTYEEVQQAIDGNPNETTAALVGPVLAPLYQAFRALDGARAERGALDLDLPERRVIVNEAQTACRIEKRDRLDSHRLIEEFMITANIAAAKELERLRQACMYRIHEPPDPIKIEALAEVLDSFGYRLARGQVIRPKNLNGILAKFQGKPESPMISELILRSQSQAQYNPKNRGHFGLALTHYAHFTSPIRRYADLLVHRALVSGLKMGPGGLEKGAGAEFEQIGEAISACERRSIAAERQAVDRFTAAFLADRVGAAMPGRISGITRFGLFIALEESGGEGLIPLRALTDDYYDHDRSSHSLTGRRWGRSFRLGDRVSVKIEEVEPLTGSVILSLIDSGQENGGRENSGQEKSGQARRKDSGKRRGKKRIKKRK
ncbi:MAG: ribonuclease R [Pseudomonadota bacterium]